MKIRNILMPLLAMMCVLTLSSQAYSICGDGALEDQEVLYGVQGGNGGGPGTPSELLILDPASGTVLESVGNVGYTMTGLAIDPQTGILYGATGRADPANPGNLISIDWVTGAGTIIGDINLANDNTAADISFAPDGTLYGWLMSPGGGGGGGADDLITIDLSTGLGTVVAPSGITNAYGNGLAALDNNTLYLIRDGEDSIFSTINAATGIEDATIALNNGLGNNYAINALAFNEAGVLYGVRNDFDGMTPNDLIIIDPTTGNITTVGPSDNRLDGIVFYNPNEACDDGNTTDGDGCSAACDAVGAGYTCDTPGAPCEAICGDGVLAGTEVCDDGNTLDGDGCSADCLLIEPNFSCPVAGQACQVSPLFGEVNGGGCSLQGNPENTLYLAWIGLGLLLSLGAIYRVRRN